MKYWVTYDDLFGHSELLGEFTDLSEAQEFFKAECYTPASEYDDFIILEAYDDDGEWNETLDDYMFTRLDREDD